MGPLGRTAEDAAIILDTIRGKDGIDTSACNVALPNPFNIDVTNLTIGYLPDTPKAVRTVLASVVRCFSVLLGLATKLVGHTSG